MKPSSGIAWIGTAAASVALAATLVVAQAEQQPTFKSTVDVVAVDASVRDGATVVTGLGPADFQVLDNGVRQTITNVSYGKLPIDVTVTLDVSFSERGAALARLQQGVLELATDLEPDDRLRLVAFNQDVRRVVDFTSSRSAITTAVHSITAGGGTAIYDALAVALVAPTSPERRQLVMIFTDGADTASITEPRQILEAAERGHALVTAVMPRGAMPRRSTVTRGGIDMSRPQNGPQSAPQVMFAGQAPGQVLNAQVQLMTKLTSQTGGRILVDPGPPANLGTAFRLALDAFRESYVLYFAPEGVDRGGNHTLAVSLVGHPRDTLLARSGYFGG